MVIGAGILARLAWIGIGLARLRRIRHGAIERAMGFDDLRQAINAGDVPIFWSHATPHPVTFGAARPVILLPVAIKSVDLAAQRAVVAHELHHVKRRDWMWTIGEEILRAIFWFHPGMWWLISRVQLAREAVVDELSILTTNARRAYLDTLLAFADDTGLRSTTAFSARRHLFHRVMLLSKEGTMSSARVAFASCLLAFALAGGTWKAVSAFPLHDTAVRQEPPPPPPPPPPQPQTREGHHAVATYYYEIAQRDTSLTPEQQLQAILKGIAAEDRALALDPRYLPALVYKGVLLRLQANMTVDPSARERLLAEADDVRQTANVLRGGATRSPDASMPPPPPPPPPPRETMVFVPAPVEPRGTTDDPVQIGGPIAPPAKIHDVRPVYPPIAREARVQGAVVVQILIDSAGYVAEAHILRSIPLLDQAALDAVTQWKFAPIKVNGVARPAIMTTTVNFYAQ